MQVLEKLEWHGSMRKKCFLRRFAQEEITLKEYILKLIKKDLESDK